MPNSNWTVEVDQASSADWSRMLDLFDDANIYQTAAYGEVHWGARKLSRIVLKRDGEVVGMAQLRIIRPTPFNFGMAYLRWGPLWERREQPLDPEVPLQMARAIEDEYLNKRKLYLRILPNAFEGTDRARIFQSAFAKFYGQATDPADIYRTFVVDLAPSLDQLRSGLDAKWRNKLKQSEKNNLKVISASGTDAFRTFCRMYAEMRQRKTFETTVDAEEFARMQEVLPESQRMRVLVCMDKEAPVAGVVASAIGNSAIYLLGATSDAGLNARGAYLLQWTAMCWLKEQGTRFYDLGGIDPEGNPGVYYFKRGFSGMDIRQIPPHTACQSAVSSAMVRTGMALRRAKNLARKPRNASPALKQPATES
jgi:lipid II:glycine glycyltransferase (peptidoglycan interpeptide bridge formation enzyme)